MYALRWITLVPMHILLQPPHSYLSSFPFNILDSAEMHDPSTHATHNLPCPHCLPGQLPSTSSPCYNVARMHSPLYMQSGVDFFLCRWWWCLSGSGEDMETSIKCENCNEALYCTAKQNCFCEFHLMWSIVMYSGGIWLDCSWVMWI